MGCIELTVWRLKKEEEKTSKIKKRKAEVVIYCWGCVPSSALHFSQPANRVLSVTQRRTCSSSNICKCCLLWWKRHCYFVCEAILLVSFYLDWNTHTHTHTHTHTGISAVGFCIAWFQISFIPGLQQIAGKIRSGHSRQTAEVSSAFTGTGTHPETAASRILVNSVFGSQWVTFWALEITSTPAPSSSETWTSASHVTKTWLWLRLFYHY